jgi:signal-transduction protein with cAMP-binding, CBS, and nucleotidyltransferase domain
MTACWRLWRPYMAATASNPSAPSPRGRECWTPDDDLAEHLTDLPLLAGLGVDAVVCLARAATPVHVRAGTWLFRQGDAGDTLLVVRSGLLEAVLEYPGPPVVLRRYRAGSAVGELALLYSTPRSASVRAVRDSDLWQIGRDDFAALLTEVPDIALALARTLGDRRSLPPPTSSP